MVWLWWLSAHYNITLLYFTFLHTCAGVPFTTKTALHTDKQYNAVIVIGRITGLARPSVRPFSRPSVCSIRALNSKTKKRIKTKICVNVPHGRSNRQDKFQFTGSTLRSRCTVDCMAQRTVAYHGGTGLAFLFVFHAL